MIENKELKFKVELEEDVKYYTIEKNGQPTRVRCAYNYIKGTFTTTVGYGYVKSFNSYYGSKPCYDEDYEGETEYEYEKDLTDWVGNYDNDEYWKGLKERNPELYSKFWDENGDWIDDNAEEQAMYDLIMDIQSQDEYFWTGIQEEAQEDHDDHKDDYDPY